MSDSAVVWSNTLDNEYRCYVLKQVDTWGWLRMERLDTGERILDEAVALSVYFRDDDVLWWGRRCMQVARKWRKNLSGTMSNAF